MSKQSIKVNVRPGADNYAGPGEKIIEFSSPAGGGLISFRLTDDGRLVVEPYNYDKTVEVRPGSPAE